MSVSIVLLSDILLVDISDVFPTQAWFYGEGLSLPVEMEYDLSLAKQAYNLAERWDAARSKSVDSLDFKSTDLDSFDTNQKSE